MLLRLAEKRDYARLRQAMDLGADPDATTFKNLTLLMYAVIRSDVELANLLLGTGRCNTSLLSLSGWPALMLAVQHSGTTMVRALISAGCDVNVRCARGNTALHTASMLGSMDALRLLLDAGANVHAINMNGADPLLQVCGTCGTHGLLRSGANVSNGFTVLPRALERFP